MLFGTNAPFIEELYEDYLENPSLVLPEWCSYFDELQKVVGEQIRMCRMDLYWHHSCSW